MAISTMDPSHSLFAVAMYAFTEPYARYQLSVGQCRSTGQPHVFCPYGAQSSSRRLCGNKKRIDSIQNNVMIQSYHF